MSTTVHINGLTLEPRMSLLNERSADDEIRRALTRGNPAAIELIWDRYADDLLALITATLRSRAEAEDVLQAVFINIIRNRHRLAGARRPRAYLYRIARNEAVTFLRKRRRERTERQPWLAPVASGETDRDLVEQLEIALNRLPQPQRQAVVLKTFRGKTFQEIALMLGISLNTAASRYRYGMERLRNLLKDHIP